MKITLLCSDSNHPVNAYLLSWIEEQIGRHEVDLIRKKEQLKGGDILFLISCSEIIHAIDRSNFLASLVLHASDLPNGRGWSPHIWQLSQGAEFITLSLVEVEDKVDSGKIWNKIRIWIPKHALWDEINHLLFLAELQMIEYAVKHFGCINPQEQIETMQPNYYKKRSPKDSRIDANKSIAEQFDLIRVCDPNRFPAYFDYLGQRYILKLEKLDEQ